jgi:DNA-binding MarR family transcriptional regulator
MTRSKAAIETEVFRRISGMPDAFFEHSRRRYPEADLSALRVFLAMRTAVRRIDNVAAIWLDRHKMTVTKFDVLHLVASADQEGTTITALGELLRMTQPNVTFVVNNLEREGLIRRTQDASDRRSRIVSITKKGLARLDDLTPPQLAAIASAMRDVSHAERVFLMKLMADIADAFERIEPR